jgi:hypothetical protein
MQTQKQITDSMIQQLRILDPSISAEVGTPERKIIETVAAGEIAPYKHRFRVEIRVL